MKDEKTRHGSRNARMFGTAQAPAPAEHNEEPRPYKGFLIIRCDNCGKIGAFCTKRETYGFKCRECGEITLLENLRPFYMRCRCGKEFRYRTNLKDENTSHICISCGAEVQMRLNGRKTAYVTKQGGHENG